VNVITADKTYATYDNAVRALDKALSRMNLNRDEVRWLIAVSPNDGRFVPTVLSPSGGLIQLAHLGVMVIG
jgi:hypothetical protein